MVCLPNTSSRVGSMDDGSLPCQVMSWCMMLWYVYLCPPRVHLHKSTKPKPSTGKKHGATKAAPTKKDRKRHASTSGDESEEQSEDLEPKARKKHARQEATTSEEEVEEVNDNPVPKPPMEHVSDVDDEQSEQPDEDEVSTDDYISQRMDQLTR